MSIATSDYVLLLNSDCLLADGVIHKLMNAMGRDKKIGLMCPISYLFHFLMAIIIKC